LGSSGVLLKGGYIMEYIYAQLNNENICIGLSQLSGEVSSENLIKLESYDASLLGKKYHDGGWLEVEIKPVTTPIKQPSETELTMMSAIAELYEIVGGNK
jgi:hypothetical protein